MAITRNNQAELVQRQINAAQVDLRKVKEGRLNLETDITDVGGILHSSEEVSWSRKYFVENQTRCIFFNQTTSGWGSRQSPNFGWCELSAQASMAGTGVEDSHEWLDARNNWQGDLGGNCRVGQYTLCSGYRGSAYYVPPPIQFRSTNAPLVFDKINTIRGSFTDNHVQQYKASMYSIELLKLMPGVIPFEFRSDDSVGIYASGHLKYSSGHTPNYSTRYELPIVASSWVRVDFIHYSPESNGRFSMDDEFFDYIDMWRLPKVPEQPQAFYSSFTRKEGGSVAKFSYVLAYLTPDNNDPTVEYVDIDWRAPNLLQGWRRVTVPVTQIQDGGSYVQVSGLFRVPHSQSIECRARSVNHWGDPGPWHTVSGFVSSAGNVRPAPSPGPAVDFDTTVAPANLQFSVRHHITEDWAEFILVSGFKNDHYVAVNAVFSGASPGDTKVKLFSTPGILCSGMLVCIGSPYTGSSGEFHICNGLDPNDNTYVQLSEPVAYPWTAATLVYFYNVAKRTSEDKFSLFLNDTNLRYYNMAARNYNGGISAFAKSISSWHQAQISITASGGLFEDDGATLGRNILRNGSFEFPRYQMNASTHEQVVGKPLSWWYLVSGVGDDQSGFGPEIDIEYRSHGRQSLRFQRITSSANVMVGAGRHSGIWQDIYDARWGKTYTFKADAHVQRENTSPYALSGMFAIYYELWEYDSDLQPIRDFSQGDIPAGASFLSSGMSAKYVATKNGTPSATDLFPTTIKCQVNTTGVSNPTIKSPLVRLCVYRPWENAYSPASTGGFIGLANWEPQFVDSCYFGYLERESHQFDEDIDMRRFAWEAIRTNSESETGQGDHLDVDSRFGFIVTRRIGNPVPENDAATSSLLAYTISGQLDIPRLTHWFPNTPSLVGSPAHYAANSDNWLIKPTSSLLVVPSGRALMYDIDIRRTFAYNSDTEITMNGASVPYIIPSGTAQYGASQIWFDPGVHSVFTVKDVLYDVVGGSSGLRASQHPMSAHRGDLKIKNVRLSCYTGLGIPTATGSPNSGAVAYWHVADIKFYEIASPFLCSGINTTGGNTVGYSARNGLINLTVDSKEGRKSTSVYKE